MLVVPKLYCFVDSGMRTFSSFNHHVDVGTINFIIKLVIFCLYMSF